MTEYAPITRRSGVAARGASSPSPARPRPGVVQSGPARAEGFDPSRLPGHVLGPRLVQARLEVGPSGDRFEREADRIAAALTTSPRGSVPSISRIGPASPAQRECSCGSCSACEREGATLRGKTNGADLSVAPGISSRIAAAAQGGQPLPASERAFFEPRLGVDLGAVKIHANAESAALSGALHARAFTLGQHIHFNRGRYEPGSSDGRHLLAHELVHVVQQSGAEQVQRAPDDESPAPNAAAQAAAKATALETEILAHAVYKALPPLSQGHVQQIIALAKAKPAGDGDGQQNYYLRRLKDCLDAPTPPAAAGSGGYGCSASVEKMNRDNVAKALAEEQKWWEGTGFENVEEDAVATGTNKVQRTGRGGKTFFVDRSDPRNLRVLIKVKLSGKADEVDSIRKLEDAIERNSATRGYSLDIVFVDTSGPDVFEFSVMFCVWPNSGNWASSPVTLSHEVHHALGLEDRYDYIKVHASNPNVALPRRLTLFIEQMKKSAAARDPHSKMATSSNPLLAEDVCAVAFETAADRTKCVDARKGLDPAGLPPP